MECPNCGKLWPYDGHAADVCCGGCSHDFYVPADAITRRTREIIAELLANPYPHDLIAIRREVERDWWGDEEIAREEMDCYCTQESMLEARRKATAAQDAAREWLSSQNTQLSDAQRSE